MTPSITSCTPPTTSMTAVVEAQPWGTWGSKILLRIAQSAKRTPADAQESPSHADSLKGKDENPTYPENANRSSLRSVYFGSPAFLESRSYSTPICLNPTQLRSPLKNRLRSLNATRVCTTR